MVFYNCYLCNFKSPNKYNYNQHCKSKKHLDKLSKSESGNVEKCGQNVENVEKNAYLIQKRNKIMHFFWKKVHKIFVNYAVRFFQEVTA